jgi:hypothetical protein
VATQTVTIYAVSDVTRAVDDDTPAVVEYLRCFVAFDPDDLPPEVSASSIISATLRMKRIGGVGTPTVTADSTATHVDYSDLYTVADGATLQGTLDSGAAPSSGNWQTWNVLGTPTGAGVSRALTDGQAYINLVLTAPVDTSYSDPVDGMYDQAFAGSESYGAYVQYADTTSADKAQLEITYDDGVAAVTAQPPSVFCLSA